MLVKVSFLLSLFTTVLIPVICPGAMRGQLRGQADSFQPPLDGHLRAADAPDGSAAVGGDGEQSQSC